MFLWNRNIKHMYTSPCKSYWCYTSLPLQVLLKICCNMFRTLILVQTLFVCRKITWFWKWVSGKYRWIPGIHFLKMNFGERFFVFWLSWKYENWRVFDLEYFPLLESGSHFPETRNIFPRNFRPLENILVFWKQRKCRNSRNKFCRN